VLVDLRARGWHVVDAFSVSYDIDVYREYLHGAAGELSVAKSTYVRTRSGWFSDRSECFLASGRPVIVQDTGWSMHLPTGDGLFAFTDADTACSAVEAVLRDPVGHGRAARELAREHFADDVVLPRLLEVATSKHRAQ
jgi:hypothetical protein